MVGPDSGGGIQALKSRVGQIRVYPNQASSCRPYPFGDNAIGPCTGLRFRWVDQWPARCSRESARLGARAVCRIPCRRTTTGARWGCCALPQMSGVDRHVTCIWWGAPRPGSRFAHRSIGQGGFVDIYIHIGRSQQRFQTAKESLGSPTLED